MFNLESEQERLVYRGLYIWQWSSYNTLYTLRKLTNYNSLADYIFKQWIMLMIVGHGKFFFLRPVMQWNQSCVFLRMLCHDLDWSFWSLYAFYNKNTTITLISVPVSVTVKWNYIHCIWIFITVTSAWKQLFRALLLLCVLFEINGQHALMLCGDSHIITAQEAEFRSIVKWTKIARKDVAWPMLCWLLLALSMYYICSHAGLHYSTFSLAHKTSRHVVSVSL